MSILTRKKIDCETHDWSSTVTAGLRRSICRACGTITLEAVTLDLRISETLREAADSVR
jgi:hypothetical protein